MRITLSHATVLTSLFFSTQIQAGARPIEIRFSNLTPDKISSEASKECVHSIRKELLQREYRVVYTSETPLRKAIGATKKDKPFMQWSVQQVQPALDTAASENSWFDGLVAVDCRPQEKRLDVLIINSADYRAQVRLRGLTLSDARLRWAAEEIGHQASEGWSP